MTANTVTFPSLCSSVLCLPRSRWLCLCSWAAQHPGVVFPQMFRPRMHPGSSVPLWDLLPEGRGCTFMPCLQDMTSVPNPPVGQQRGGTASRNPAVTMSPPLPSSCYSALYSYWCQGCLFKEQMNLPQESPVLGLHVLLIKIAFNY